MIAAGLAALPGAKTDAPGAAPHLRRPAPAMRRYVAGCGERIHRLSGKDTTGRRACYLVLVPHGRERAFNAAIAGTGMIDLETLGDVVDSCYGEEPDAAMRERVRANYGFLLAS